MDRVSIEECLSIRRIPEIPLKAVAFHVTAPSLLAPDEEFEMNITAIRTDGYPATDFEGGLEIESTDEGARIRRNLTIGREDHGTCRIEDGKMGTPGVHRIVVKSKGSSLRGTSNPIKCSEEKRDHNLYWGDLHVHNPSHNPRVPSIEVEESLDWAYRFGRYVSGVDFGAVTDHAYILDEEKWQVTRLKAEEYNEPGEFLTFLGFESSHRTEKGGDESVYYLNGGEFRNFLPDDGSLDDLWRWLRRQSKEFITVPHHTARIQKSRDWSLDYYGGPNAEPVYEIYSRWGTCEFRGNPRSVLSALDSRAYFQDALARGYRLGVVAGSDDHQTTPGRKCLGSGQRASGGLAAIYAKSLTRMNLWEALKRRRCYGTTRDRILIEFRIDNYAMGEELQSRNPEIAAEAYGTVPFVRAEVVKNGEVIYGHKLLEDWPKGKVSGAKIARTSEITFSFRDRVVNDSYYYFRVIQRNGEMAWSSPIWIRP